MVDAGLREMVRPDAEGLAIRHGECEVVHVLIRRSVRPSIGLRGLCEHDHELGPTVPECDVSDAGILRERDESERFGVPARTRPDVCNEQLEVGEPGNGRRGHRFVDRGHGNDDSDRTREVRTDLRHPQKRRAGTTAGWAGAKRRRPATGALLRRPLPPDTSPPLLARKVAPTRMRGNTATVNGSKVPYSLSTVAPPVR